MNLRSSSVSWADQLPRSSPSSSSVGNRPLFGLPSAQTPRHSTAEQQTASSVLPLTFQAPPSESLFGRGPLSTFTGLTPATATTQSASTTTPTQNFLETGPLSRTNANSTSGQGGLWRPPTTAAAWPSLAPQESSSSSSSSQNKEEELSCWVTVFGFPPRLTSFILQEFAQYGTVTKHCVPPQPTNYMHLKFQNVHQAKRALAANGKKTNSVLIIGVKECQDQYVLEDQPTTHQIRALNNQQASTATTGDAQLEPQDNTTTQQPTFHNYPCAGSARTFGTLETTDLLDAKPRKRPRTTSGWVDVLVGMVLGK